MKIHGKMVKCPGNYTAYVPNPLPPPIEWDDKFSRVLSEADRLIGQLTKLGTTIPNPHLFIRPFVRREAVLSSRIEGTQTSLAELFADEAGTDTHQNQSDIQEVKNYVKSLEYGIKRLKTLPLSLRLILELHQHLMKGVRGNYATPGAFRKTQNWIGVAGCTLQNASYVPPPPHDVLNCMGDLEKFLYESTLPPLVTIGLAHQQFEAIHPFLDGNGRIGRLLITLFLIDRKILDAPILYISAFFEANRREYYERLNAVNEFGDWLGWMEYFLNGVAAQSKDAIARIEKIQKLVTSWKIKFPKKSDKQCLILINDIMANPFVTANGTTKKHKIAFPTAQRAIDKLVNANILKQTYDTKRNRIYCAKQILKILDDPTKI
jgi:Fic family protein